MDSDIVSLFRQLDGNKQQAALNYLGALLTEQETETYVQGKVVGIH